MSQRDENTSPDDIEAEIHQTREELDDTLHELEHRLSPQHAVDVAMDRVRNGGANEFLSNLGRTIKENPLPVLVTGIGLGWLILSQRKSQKQEQDYSYADDYALAAYNEGTGIAARNEAPQRMTAVHLGTQQDRSHPSQHRPEVVGEATHLGTGQGWNGYVRPA
ncbi:DUF3618 domain-containing protein [Litchfieldella xinjiangensis]|uniref:DUF3618 domain-containing protein n=1 Tax=Litchfieldella xinjiangensis TaxID=1166948 RepID=UPI000694C1AA|nr:DUF3618 domain-containing protein [Halomonas xinjiangensis]